jgi:osmotically-inducible protein OsmY
MLRKTATTILLLGLCINLTGCPALLLGGGVGAARVAFDRRSSGAQADDNIIDIKVEGIINQKINENRASNEPKSSVKLMTYNRGTLMMGVVRNEQEKQTAERIVRAQPNVRKVYNHISITPDGRTFGNTSRDTWITSKIRTNLMGAKGFAPNHVKIVTYNGVTYVMGILTPDEQAAATKIVSETAGVQKVITLYETFTEEK